MSQKTNKIPSKPLAFLFYLSRPFKKWALWATTAVIIASALNTSYPYIYKKVVDTVVNISPGAEGSGWVLFWILMYPTVNLFTGLLWRLSGLLGMKWCLGVEAYGYKKLFAYLSKHSQAFFDNRFAGSLISKISTASSSAESIISSFLYNYLSMFSALVVSMIYAATVKPSLGLVFAGLALVLVPMNLFIIRFRRSAAEAETALQNNLRGKLVDIATNMVAVRQFAMRGNEVGEVTKMSERYRKAMEKSWVISEGIILANLIVVGIFVYIISVITYQTWVSGSATPGDVVLVFTLIGRLIYDLMFIGMSMNHFAKNFGEIKESLEDIIIEHEIKDAPNAPTLKVTEGKISIRDLYFQYHKEQAIFEGLNIEIPANQKLGIIGPSGSGKSTFIKLLLRQYDINSGGIYVDGQDVATVTQDSLHEAISIVPQEPMLFHRTIKENIAYGQEKVSHDEIIKAAKKAEAHDFIMTLPNGYETLVGERGVKLSAGQRQRVAIARAILKNSKILILDEATSALDSESEVAIQKALHNLMGEKTVLAIAHRLSTLSEMDRIIVIKDGKIVEDGNHKDLIEQKGLYEKLWSHQAGGFLKEE